MPTGFCLSEMWTRSRFLSPVVPVVPVVLLLGVASIAAQEPPPRILLDQSPRAVEYQLARLSDDRLAQVERKPDDVRYVPVYYALLTRAGMSPEIREEAVAALTTLEQTSRTAVLLAAISRVTDANAAAADTLARLLLAQPAADLAGARAHMATVAADASASPRSLEAAYAAMMRADREVAPAWSEAATRQHLGYLLRGVRHLPSDADADVLRAGLFPRVAALVTGDANGDERLAAIEAVAWIGRDADAFGLLARVVADDADNAPAIAAAVRGLLRVPQATWPGGGIESLARALLARLTRIPPDARTEPDAIDATALAERLVGELPAERARALRAELRDLGVRVVRIEALPEQVAFDLRWFVVEAGRPVQIVLVNPDAMPHNLVIGVPGSLERIGTEGGNMPMPDDPQVKPFVPNLPEVLHATRLVRQGDTDRLSFIAPETPGDYIFACTFPGHWTRMYGVMLVVSDLEAWEAAPTPPIDPMTGQSFGDTQDR